MRITSAPLLLVLATPALGQDSYTEVGGMTYMLESFSGSARLLSLDTHPVDWVRLWQDCRAVSEVSDGSWAWDATGFWVLLAEREIRVEGKAPPLDAPACGG